jgi:hypothetical protein
MEYQVIIQGFLHLLCRDHGPMSLGKILVGVRIGIPNCLAISSSISSGAGRSDTVVRVHIAEKFAAGLGFCRPGQPNLILETGEAVLVTPMLPRRRVVYAGPAARLPAPLTGI